MLVAFAGLFAALSVLVVAVALVALVALVVVAVAAVAAAAVVDHTTFQVAAAAAGNAAGTSVGGCAAVGGMARLFRTTP